MVSALSEDSWILTPQPQPPWPLVQALAFQTTNNLLADLLTMQSLYNVPWHVMFRCKHGGDMLLVPDMFPSWDDSDKETYSLGYLVSPFSVHQVFYLAP